MKRRLEFNQGIIGGEDADTLLSILPQLEKSFAQRKTYYEYYFTPTAVELSLEDIKKLSNEFTIVLNWDELIIKL